MGLDHGLRKVQAERVIRDRNWSKRCKIFSSEFPKLQISMLKRSLSRCLMRFVVT